ncbi:CcdB family protein [Sphingosinicella sp. BN140058]|uniref:CcdB family protein n=1 Tax=Sphingosinicella sp. BN140058 TaxID=1892855 RepID=UPI0010103DC4|nr:CcdB family protein [Sphingosinicella sp. BN140058]QAY77980.1 plasmid maintenance protein CcdB [Sphingosinicella sp. BN140058]
MARFDIFRMGDALVLDCQADLLSDLPTRIVVPLLPKQKAPPAKKVLNPIFRIDQAEYVLATEFVACVDRRELGAWIGTLSHCERDVVGALNLLLTGF